MRLSYILLIAVIVTACTQTPEPCGPVPTPAQVAWQQMEMNMFVHFGPNTFSGLEWGTGTEPEDLFRPTELDCRQWARTAKAAGMQGIIVTAKHHDGFCLWPNPASTHCVPEELDVLKALSEACLAEGVKFGVYISPWDRNDPAYGTPEYNGKYAETLRSVHDGTYGPIFEQWFDGACGEGPNGKRQEYDWPLFNSTVRALQPDAIQFSDIGPDCRWVGNERGEAGETNWSTLNIEGFTPGTGGPSAQSLNEGDEDGSAWIPAEADVSIRPGWFWRESEDSQVKSVDQLMDIWYSSVGRNAVLLLNVPADTRGKIPAVDSLRLMEFRARRDSIFAENLAGRVSRRKNTYTVKVSGPFNLVQLQEDIRLGQRVSSLKVEAETDGGWAEIATGTTIGYKRILRIPETSARRVRVTITGAKAAPHLTAVDLYRDPAPYDNNAEP